MISIIGKDMNEEYGCIAQFRKNMKPQLFFLKKPLVLQSVVYHGNI